MDVPEALRIASQATQIARPDLHQRANIVLALEIRRLNEMINELYASKTPTAPTGNEWRTKNAY